MAINEISFTRCFFAQKISFTWSLACKRYFAPFKTQFWASKNRVNVKTPLFALVSPLRGIIGMWGFQRAQARGSVEQGAQAHRGAHTRNNRVIVIAQGCSIYRTCTPQHHRSKTWNWAPPLPGVMARRGYRELSLRGRIFYTNLPLSSPPLTVPKICYLRPNPPGTPP